MFSPVSSRVSFPELDARVLQDWKDKDVFRRTESERQDAPLFMLYEGPPTANGSPGIHHVLARVFKDVICRYHTMKGYRCLRKGGWDTHGLPVELEIEKELGLNTKREIEEYGIEKFNRQCRDSVFRYVKDWEVMTDRIGYWVDMENPYVTLENDYIETGWWILKELWDKDLLYQDLRGTPHCPRCVTSLSSHEVALGYQEDTPDPSVFVKFQVDATQSSSGDAAEQPANGAASNGLLDSGLPTYLLAWTTTPWTLPGNTALAVDPNSDYSVVELNPEGGVRQRVVLASALLETSMRGEYTPAGSLKGADLVGIAYVPLYQPSDYGTEVRRFQRRSPGGPSELHAPSAETPFVPRVVAADFVSMEDGTGIVHIAPAFGDEDLSLGRDKELAFIQPVDLLGNVTANYPFSGKFVKEADEDIMADLQQRGLLHHRDIYRHTYPFCWRCETPLLYYAKSSWYIRTSRLKDRMVEGNSAINWYPDYIKEGRFGEWLRNNIDWAISRERYWGTPIPIWQCKSCNNSLCVGSLAELRELAVPEHQGKLDGLDLHRPYVDEIALTCPTEGCGGQMERVPEVMDAWFDSGAMPFAQWHTLKQEDVRELRKEHKFPADYICEAVDQTRGWFYSLHALSTLMEGEPSYRNVICLGLILDERGQKMSKRIGNVVDPLAILDEHGADALRWYLFTASHPGEARRFSSRLVNETVRRVLLTLWNVYSFFTSYASIDKFDPGQEPPDWKPDNELDRWILSELNALVEQVDQFLGSYDPTNAGRRIQEFIDRLSNWYVRRSRRRFWKSDNDADKLSAYLSLYYCLKTVAKLMAPLAPFLAEELYQGLVKAADPKAPDSVHLAEFPKADPSLVDQPLMEATRLGMRVASMGRSARSKAGLRVRQPLATVSVKVRSTAEKGYLELVQDQVLEELNIKSLIPLEDDSSLYAEALEAAAGQSEATLAVGHHWVSLEAGYAVAVNAKLTPELAEEGLARELVHRIQNLRRSADFEITDRIVTYYQAPETLAGVMTGVFSSYIRDETLSDGLMDAPPPEEAKAEAAKIDGQEITLAVLRT